LNGARRATAFAVGASVGPFRDAGAEAACSRFLQRLAFVGVRDRVSLDRARSIAPHANVRLTFDLAPALLLVPGFQDTGSESQRTGLGISLCNYERFTGGDTTRETRRLAAVASAVRSAADAGLLDHVVLIDFNGHPRFGDHELHLELADRIGDRLSVEHVRYNDNPVEVLQRVGTLRAMLAMRLHAAVFAFCTGTPALMVCYHEKCREWADMIRLPSDCMVDAAECDAADLESRFERLCGSCPPMPEMSRAEATALTLGNWTWLT
jgi:polysaccharide pyruvyl transferase WcaK-like protein